MAAGSTAIPLENGHVALAPRQHLLRLLGPDGALLRLWQFPNKAAIDVAWAHILHMAQLPEDVPRDVPPGSRLVRSWFWNDPRYHAPYLQAVHEQGKWVERLISMSHHDFPIPVYIQCFCFDSFMKDGEGLGTGLEAFEDFPGIQGMQELELAFESWCNRMMELDDREWDLRHDLLPAKEHPPEGTFFAHVDWDAWFIEGMNLAARLKALLQPLEPHATVACVRFDEDPKFSTERLCIIMPPREALSHDGLHDLHRLPEIHRGTVAHALFSEKETRAKRKLIVEERPLPPVVQLDEEWSAAVPASQRISLYAPDGRCLGWWRTRKFKQARAIWRWFTEREGAQGQLSAVLPVIEKWRDDPFFGLQAEQVDVEALRRHDQHAGVRLRHVLETPAGEALFDCARLAHCADSAQRGQVWRSLLQWRKCPDSPAVTIIDCEWQDAWAIAESGSYHALEDFEHVDGMEQLRQAFEDWCGLVVALEILDDEIGWDWWLRHKGQRPELPSVFRRFDWDGWFVQGMRHAARLRALLGDRHLIICQRHVRDPAFDKDRWRVILPRTPQNGQPD